MFRRCCSALCIALVGLLSAGSSMAHETEEVGGYELTAGWAEEPTYVGMRNAVQLIVRRGGQPVEGLAEQIQVEVRFGEETTGPMPLRAEFGSPGEYRADLIPTRPGAYVFHFTGEIDGEEIDQEFSPPGFDEARTTADIEVPVADPSRAELAQSVEQAGPRLMAATEAADGARRTALVAAVLAGLALVAAIAALVLALGGRRRAA